MHLLKTYKIQLTETALILLLFIFSISLRKDEINAPLSTEHEWISAHTLITLDIWKNHGGPSAFGFNPIYTYPGKGSRGIAALGGVSDKEGNYYYISYPPFCFLFAYYSSNLLGGVDVYHLRTISLILQFLSAFLLYLVIKQLYPSSHNRVHIAALTGAALYLFSTGYLWAHAVLYFADILVQPIILAMIYLLIKVIQHKNAPKTKYLISLGIVVFIGVYTEWLALFLAFFGGISCLVLYLKYKSRSLLHAFIITGIAASLALTITIAQYSSISGFKAFKEVSLNKYEERSGHASADKTEASYNFENPESFRLLRGNVDRNFLMAENFLGISAILLIPFIIWKRTRSQMKNISIDFLILFILLISILLHYILFYNFNAIHNFSNLKTGLFMILTAAVMLKIIEQSIDWKIQIGFGIVILVLLFVKGSKDFDRYESIFSGQAYKQDLFESAQLVRKYADKDSYVFMNIYAPPSYFYTAKHITFYLEDPKNAKGLMKNFRTKNAWYLKHDGLHPHQMIKMNLMNDSLSYTDTLHFK